MLLSNEELKSIYFGAYFFTALATLLIKACFCFFVITCFSFHRKRAMPHQHSPSITFSYPL